jgi:hypothetical protein
MKNELWFTNEINLRDGTLLTEAIRIVRAYAINAVKYSPNSMFITSLDTIAKIAEQKKITVEREIKITRGGK